MTDQYRMPASKIGDFGPAQPVSLTVPKMVMPHLETVLHGQGLELDVLDDGEDDGVIILTAVISSAAMDETVAVAGYAFWRAWAVFLGWAALVVLAYRFHEPILAAIAAFNLAYSAGATLMTHREKQKRHKIQQVMRERGF